MKKTMVLGGTMVAVGIATLTVVGAQDRHSDANAKGDSHRECNEGTLRGEYGFQLSGLRPPVGGAGPLEQFVGVGLATYDGHGSFTQVDNTHGLSGAATDRQGFGTYTVNPDCSGTATLWMVGGPPFPIEMRSVIVDDGDEIRSAVMSPAPIVVTAVGKKVF